MRSEASLADARRDAELAADGRSACPHFAAWLWLALSGAGAPHASQIALAFGVGSDFLGAWRQARYRRDNLVELEEAAGMIVLWMTQRHAVAVPVRVFANVEQRAAFLAFARGKIKPSQA